MSDLLAGPKDCILSPISASISAKFFFSLNTLKATGCHREPYYGLTLGLKTFSCVKAPKNTTSSSICDKKKKKDRISVLKEGLRGSVCQWGKEIKHTISRGGMLFEMPLAYLSNGLLRAQGTDGCTGIKMMDRKQNQQILYPRSVLLKYQDSTINKKEYIIIYLSFNLNHLLLTTELNQSPPVCCAI